MSLAAMSMDGPAFAPISPLREMGAYEALWLQKGASFKSIADRFASDSEAMPSDFVEPNEAERRARETLCLLKSRGIHKFGVRIHHAGDYPETLRDARNPVQLLYYRGVWEVAETKSVSVVGSRKASNDGLKRTKRIVQELVAQGFTIVSGLASGIDTMAHSSALEAGGLTIGVVGTPLGHVYPKENLELQERLANEQLIISQVPVLRYEQEDWRTNRRFFPERNATMSALSVATIIVEASETSGSLTQARHALYQNRKLLILDSCFERKDIEWPSRFEAQGAVRIRNSQELWDALAS